MKILLTVIFPDNFNFSYSTLLKHSNQNFSNFSKILNHLSKIKKKLQKRYYRNFISIFTKWFYLINMKYKIHQIAPWNRQKLSHSLHLQASKIFDHELRGLIQARWTQCHTDIRLPLRGFHFFFHFYSGSGPSDAWGGALGAPPEAAAKSPCFLTPDTMSSILRSNTAVWREKLNHIHSCYTRTIICNNIL